MFNNGGDIKTEMPKPNKNKENRTPLREIRELFVRAEQAFPTNKEAANRYIRKARKLAMKTRFRMPRELKRRFCKHCYAYLQPGKNARIRIHAGKVIIYCLECKKFTRIPYK